MGKILLVDDESDITFIIKKYLETQKFTVDSFTDSVKALEHYRQNLKEYSLVISDIRMPGMSGTVLAEEIKKIAPDVKVILMSAFEITETEFAKVSDSKTGIDGFMKKPVGLKALLNIVTKQLDSRESELNE